MSLRGLQVAGPCPPPPPSCRVRTRPADSRVPPTPAPELRLSGSLPSLQRAPFRRGPGGGLTLRSALNQRSHVPRARGREPRTTQLGASRAPQLRAAPPPGTPLQGLHQRGGAVRGALTSAALPTPAGRARRLSARKGPTSAAAHQGRRCAPRSGPQHPAAGGAEQPGWREHRLGGGRKDAPSCGLRDPNIAPRPCTLAWMTQWLSGRQTQTVSRVRLMDEPSAAQGSAACTALHSTGRAGRTRLNHLETPLPATSTPGRVIQPPPSPPHPARAFFFH